MPAHRRRRIDGQPNSRIFSATAFLGWATAFAVIAVVRHSQARQNHEAKDTAVANLPQGEPDLAPLLPRSPEDQKRESRERVKARALNISVAIIVILIVWRARDLTTLTDRIAVAIAMIFYVSWNWWRSDWTDRHRLLSRALKVAGIAIVAAVGLWQYDKAETLDRRVIILFLGAVYVGWVLWSSERQEPGSRSNLGAALLGGAVIAFSLFWFQASLEQERSLRLTLNSERNLPGIDLSGQKLANYYLYQKNFTGANLQEADLTEAYLAQTNLTKALLGSARLIGAELSNAQLNEADLGNASLDRANITDADFESAYLRGARLIGTQQDDTSRVNFSLADLTEADLTGANLFSADFSQATLDEADLTDANLSSADFSQATLDSVSLRRADLTSADLSVATLSHMDLSEAKLQNANLRGVDLRDVHIETAHLGQAVADVATRWPDRFNFLAAGVYDLRANANLQKAELSNQNLNSIDLRRADLRGAKLYGTDMSYANLAKVNLHGVDLSSTNLEGVILKGADLRKANLVGVDFSDADLKGADLRGANALPRATKWPRDFDPKAAGVDLSGKGVRGD